MNGKRNYLDSGILNIDTTSIKGLSVTTYRREETLWRVF
jgi:hypothetical protein